MRVQAEPRYRKRLPCRVTVGDLAHEGWIVNLSRSGLFVQTGAGVEPGAWVEVALQAPTATPDLVLRSRVVWERSVPAQHRELMGGFGVEIHHAPESYYSLLAAVERLATQVPRSLAARRARGEPPEPVAEAARSRFQIRLQQIGGTRTRTIEVDAESEADARRSVRDLVGADWSITRVERLREH